MDSSNCIVNILKRELGLTKNTDFISAYFSNGLDNLELKKQKTVETNDSSITWFSLETIDYRYLLVSKANGEYFCIDVSDEENLKTVFQSKENESHKFCISCIQWWPIDNGMFFTCGMDEIFKIYNSNSQKVISQIKMETKIYTFNISTLISGHNNLVALGLDNGLIRLLDLKSGSFSHIIKHGQNSYMNVKWSPIDNNLIASGGHDGKLLLFDIRSPNCVLTSFNHASYNNNCKGSSYRSDNSHKVAHESPILGISFTANGNYLMSIGKDDRMRLWNILEESNTFVNFGKIQLHSYIDRSCLQISSAELKNKSYIFVPSNRNLLIFDMFSGTLKKQLKGHFDSINCSLYNPNLNEIYTGSKDKNILVWGSKRSPPSVDDFSQQNHEVLKRKIDRLDYWSNDDSE